ncbi:conserved hypothetical protein [Pediculus humanus corporis]|uniref:PDZ domain-containing protein n=1 Tax=Pediculus humanus subsp. corporis TaxID=121224 RepID=E0VGI4_PEDHC|nr:uncharacterized protein Phum_PHUM183590 [Pediculus humanus corporis]EEB12490.1 conserved hypothetical protein [Pediculus humanus corporis]
MFTSKEQILTVSLQRRNGNVPWGISIVGGSDQDSPLIVSKVLVGSPCEKKLLVGDEIKKIEDYDARDVTHRTALILFNKAQNTIKLVIKSPKSYESFPIASNPETPRIGNFSLSFPQKNEYESVYFDAYKNFNGSDDNEAEIVKNQVGIFFSLSLIATGN